MDMDIEFDKALQLTKICDKQTLIVLLKITINEIKENNDIVPIVILKNTTIITDENTKKLVSLLDNNLTKLSFFCTLDRLIEEEDYEEAEKIKNIIYEL